MKRFIYTYFILSLFYAISLFAAQNPLVRSRSLPVIHESVSGFIAENPGITQLPVWVYLTDKVANNIELQTKLASVDFPARTLRRRAKVMKGPLTTFRDLPVSSQYMSQLQSVGLEKRSASKWLNAVSGTVSPERLPEIASLPFVREIRLIARKHAVNDGIDQKLPLPAPVLKSPMDSYNYGLSKTQLEQIGVPELHSRGYTGNGVIICITDTGFWLGHDALASTRVLAEYDFIHNDPVTQNEASQDNRDQHDHGTRVLSIVGGASQGNLYGPAFEAEYLLAKTEDLVHEDIVEEDYWIAAIEWADSLGADVVNSSVGYIDWYSYDDLDGNTSPMTIVSDLAAARGILVCTSVGNERDDPWYYLCVPADGDSVLSVGAVNSKGYISAFSSAGPTADGRVKPEVVARGVSVVMADADDPHGFTGSNGTSYSSPLVAGVCAQLIQAHPQWGPMQVREALMNTADRADGPDNLYGWGLVNAPAALEYQVTGDVNGDDRIDALDVQLIAGICLEPDTFDELSQRTADVNVDSNVNILDVITAIQQLY